MPVRSKITAAILKHERIITDKIKLDKHSNIQPWKQMNYLRDSKIRKKLVTLYEDTTKILEEEIKKSMTTGEKHIKSSQREQKRFGTRTNNKTTSEIRSK